jgi:hypothetical protein
MSSPFDLIDYQNLLTRAFQKEGRSGLGTSCPLSEAIFFMSGITKPKLPASGVHFGKCPRIRSINQ